MVQSFKQQDAPPGDWPQVAVIIPVYRDREGLLDCLRHLQEQDYPTPYEVVVVENDAEPALTDLQAQFPDMVFLHEPVPGSYAARNTGIAASAAKVLAFTDADCRPRPDWLRQGVLALQEQQAAMVGGHIAVMAQHAQHPSLAEHMEMALAFPQEAYIRRQQFAATANLFAWRAVFDAVGPFDARLKSGGDHEWGNRVARAGFRQVYASQAVVEHPARRHGAQLQRRMRIAGGARDRFPGWRGGLHFLRKSFFPGAHKWRALWHYRHPALSGFGKCRLWLYVLGVNIYAVLYRVKLQWGGGASHR